MTKTQEQTQELINFLLPGLTVFFLALFMISPRCAVGAAIYGVVELLGIVAIGKAIGYLRGLRGAPRGA